MPIMDGTKRGSTLSNLEVQSVKKKNKELAEHDAQPKSSTLSSSEVAEALKHTGSGATSPRTREARGKAKLKRRNSTSSQLNHLIKQNKLGLLPPKQKTEPFPGIALKEVPDVHSAPNLPDSKKEKFFSRFKRGRRTTSSPTQHKIVKQPSEKESPRTEPTSPKYDAEKIIIIQKFWRMISARKLRSCFKNRENVQKVKKNIQQLLDNEEKYLETLKTLKEHYLTPLLSARSSSGPLQEAIKDENINNLFPGLDYTVACHASFAKNLRTCLSRWPLVDFSFLLYDHVRFLTDIYEHLPKIVATTDELLQRLRTKTAFNNFCSSASKNHPPALARRTIKYLVNSPVSYVYQFEDVCRPIPLSLKVCNQFVRILQAEAITVQLAFYVQEQMEANDCRRMITKLQSVSGQKEKDKITCDPSRKFIRDRAVRVNGKQSRAFLFSDILFITHIKKDTLRFTGKYLLENLVIVESKRSVLQDKSVRCKYTISVGDKQLKFREKVTSHQNSLNFLLEEYITRSKDTVFGVSLEKSMPDPQTLPLLLCKTIFHLDKATNKTKLFRSPGNPTVIAQLRINESTTTNNDLSGSHPDDVAGLLLMYLEHLPDTFIPYSKLLKCPKLSSQLLESSSHQKLFRHVRSLILDLTAREVHFLEYLTYFLARIVASGASTPYELAHQFAKHIIRCKGIKEIEYARQMPVLIQVTELIILNRDKFFLPPEGSPPLPKSAYEFLSSDRFGSWWKLFREGEKHFIEFISSRPVVQQLLEFVTQIASQTGNNLDELAANILMSDIVARRILQSEDSVGDFFKILDKKVPEMGRKWLTDVLSKYFQLETKKIASYLTSASYSDKIIQHISSGNITTFLTSIIKQSKENSQLYPLLTHWCILAFDTMLKTEYSLTDDTLCNSVEYLKAALEEEKFVESKPFKQFKNHLSSEKLKELVALSMSTSRATTAVAIQDAITSLIASKEVSSVTVPTRVDHPSHLDTDTTELRSSALYHSGLVSKIYDDEDSDTTDEESSDSEEEEQNEISHETSVKETLTESSFKFSNEDEPNNRRALRSSSISLRWSECLGTIVNSKTDVERTNLLSLFLAQHDKISDILLDTTGENKTRFGQFRLGLLQIIQVTVFACDDTIAQQFIKSKLLNTCVKVFFLFPENNILHHLVQDTITGILQRDDDTLVYHLLMETDLIDDILHVVEQPNFEQARHHGHIILIIEAMKESNAAVLWLNKGKMAQKWMRLVDIE